MGCLEIHRRLRGGRIWLGFVASLVATSTFGCASPDASESRSSVRSGSSTDPSLHPCSPLEGEAQPITLQNVVGAGRHADGTIYVLDAGRPELRAFVSEGSILQRKKVAGSGLGGDWTIASVSDPNGPFSLKVETSGTAATRMGVFRGELDTKDFEIGVAGDVLELLDASAYAGLTVRNMPGGIRVEYDATSASNGDRLVVTRPDVDWTYEDFRVFYGTPTRMVERPVVFASRGASTYITFKVDGAEYTAVFSSTMSSLTQATLTVNGEEGYLSVIDADTPGTPGAGLTYVCL